jgi:hypothetical protein
MSEKSWDILYDKYPDLFLNRHKTPRESCLSFGIECDLGWYDIISFVCYMIKQHEENIAAQQRYLKKKEPDNVLPEYSPVRFDQVKEKWGSLRIYFSGGDDYVEGLIDMAEAFSSITCEKCSQPAKTQKIAGWVRTLCEKDAKEWETDKT